MYAVSWRWVRDNLAYKWCAKCTKKCRERDCPAVRRLRKVTKEDDYLSRLASKFKNTVNEDGVLICEGPGPKPGTKITDHVVRTGRRAGE